VKVSVCFSFLSEPSVFRMFRTDKITCVRVNLNDCVGLCVFNTDDQKRE